MYIGRVDFQCLVVFFERCRIASLGKSCIPDNGQRIGIAVHAGIKPYEFFATVGEFDAIACGSVQIYQSVGVPLVGAVNRCGLFEMQRCFLNFIERQFA